MDSKQPVPDETQALRRCIRELASLSTLSAAWSRNNTGEVAEGLCRVLCRSLSVAFVYFRVTDPQGGTALEVAGTPSGPASVDLTRRLGRTLEPLVASGGLVGTADIPYLRASGRLHLAIAAVGLEADCGLVVAGSPQPEFPTDSDRLLLSVAANQAAIVLQQRRSEGEVRRRERELSDFFENASMALHWVGPDGTILRANRAELELLGRSPDEYLGHHIAEFHADRDVIEEILRRLQSGEEIQEWPARMRHRDGSIRHVLINSNVLWDQGRFVHTRSFTRDITEQKRAEEALSKQTERLQLLWETAGILLTAGDPDAMLRGLFAKIGPHLDVDTYFNFMVDEGAQDLRLASCVGIPAETSRLIARLDFGAAICGTVALQRRPIVANNIQGSDDPKAQLVRSFGIRAYACNPLLADDVLLGTLSFATRTKDQFEPDEVAFLETVSHYVTVAYERLRLLNQLKESDRRKDEFLATLAHELRNPLSPLLNVVQVLRDKGLSEFQEHWGMDLIERQVNHLTRLVDDLLDLSRITRNRLELRKERVELAEAIKGALESSCPVIESLGHELTVHLPAEPLYLSGDLIRLSQIFLNLFNNAAKYTQRGGVILVTAEREAAQVVVRVKDNGVGIPPEKLPHLFEMFFQVDRSLERTQTGLGIGLSLVRRLVELHGGRVEARSEGVGRGSEFIVWLPVLAEASMPLESQPAIGENNVGVATARRILVVDDNQDAADALAMSLALGGDEVRTAYDGLEGIATAESFRPDVILLDIGMPRLSGLDTCRRIRAEAWGRDMVLIALTGWGQEEDRRRTAEAGFNAHLVKPVNHADLVKLLASTAVPEKQPPAPSYP